MIDKESIKARSENYAIDVNEYGPIEEAFSDGANWGIKQLQAEAEKENKRIVENGVYKIQQLQAEVDELKSDSKIQVNATREAGMLYLKHTEQLQAEVEAYRKMITSLSLSMMAHPDCRDEGGEFDDLTNSAQALLNKER